MIEVFAPYWASEVDQNVAGGALLRAGEAGPGSPAAMEGPPPSSSFGCGGPRGPSSADPTTESSDEPIARPGATSREHGGAA